MSQFTEPTLDHQPATSDKTEWVVAATPSVKVVIDSYSEIDPALAASLDLLLIRRQVIADGKLVELGPERTLHPLGWETRPRQCQPQPVALAHLAEGFQQVISQGQSVLALQPPRQLDPTIVEAFKARSIVLAGLSATRHAPPRIAVCELNVTGMGFVYLVMLAGQAAREGMALHQIVTLLDRMQSELRVAYLCQKSGPCAALQEPTKGTVSWPFQVQLWQRNAQGLLKRVVNGQSAHARLWAADGPLSGYEPDHILSTDLGLFDKLNERRLAMGRKPWVASGGGLSLQPLFRHGAIECTVFPAPERVKRVSTIISQIDSPPLPRARGVAERGGL